MPKVFFGSNGHEMYAVLNCSTPLVFNQFLPNIGSDNFDDQRLDFFIGYSFDMAIPHLLIPYL